MAIEVIVPRLGWSMDEGTFTEWLKRDGEQVRKGEMLFVLESDKATQEIESFDEGILRLLPDGPAPGDAVQVGQLLAYLVAEGEAPPRRPAAAEAARIAQPSAQPVAESPAGQPVLQDPPATPGRRHATPRARRRAAELGIDWTTLKGSGRGGRIRERDVQATPEQAPPPAAAGESTDDSLRRIIAERMLTSHSTTAPVTLTTTADATNLVNLRNQFKASADDPADVPSFTDFAIKLVAVALQQHPQVNSRWESQQLVRVAELHIGMAVHTAAGLLVPVIRDADRLGLRQLASHTRDLIARARARRLAPDELTGGTFTVTNLGAYGIDAFTPLINTPQCAILGLGRIERRPVVQQDAIVAREQTTLSLTFDHRLIDGVPAAEFLQSLVRLLETPGPWLIS